MPALIAPREPHFLLLQHDTAEDFLSVAYPTLHAKEASSNIILAHALKMIHTEGAMTEMQFTCNSDVQDRLQCRKTVSSPHRSDSCFWLTLWSYNPFSRASPFTLDMALSCVRWKLGEYPIFLWTPFLLCTSEREWLEPRVDEIVDSLQVCVPTQRVFSVFGQETLIKQFAKCWSKRTGVKIEKKPFYEAYFSYCEKDTLQTTKKVLPPGHNLRRAIRADREHVAKLCKEFADDSVYFPLDFERALVEADELISKGQIWVYDTGGDIATICAVTRTTQRVSAITKVYTAPSWRRKGCAEFLVRDVTTRLLHECGKDTVILYVGYDNSARFVYDKVGFQGLRGRAGDPRIERSLELGFSDTKRGHW